MSSSIECSSHASHVKSRLNLVLIFLRRNDEYTALVKFGNVASEHVKSAISVVPASAQCSAVETQCSAAEWGWRFGDSSSCLDESSQPVGGPGKDTHGTPVPNSGKAVCGPIRRSASQQLIDTRNAKVV